MYTYERWNIYQFVLNEEKERRDKKGKNKFTEISADGNVSSWQYMLGIKNDKSKSQMGQYNIVIKIGDFIFRTLNITQIKK